MATAAVSAASCISDVLKAENNAEQCRTMQNIILVSISATNLSKKRPR
jgi:hypothetical protein